MVEKPVLSIGELLGAPPELATPGGLALRGLESTVSGMPYQFEVLERNVVWSDGIEKLYEQAKARQWNASTDIPWERGIGVAIEPVERALCTILTWMVQQEFAAWYIPSKFIPKIHPSFLEPVLFLSTQVIDEARHVEAFTKRLFLNGVGFIGTYPGTESSIAGLIQQDDFDKASFLLHVLGEGTFLDLFAFLRKYAPDEATKQMFIRTHEDESRHVAYGTGRLRSQLRRDEKLVHKFVEGLEERVTFAQDVSGIPSDVQEAMVVLASRGERGASYAKGMGEVLAFQDELSENRIRRLVNSGFPEAAAKHISDLHAQSAGNAM